MSYYMGDFYRGDPGIIDFFKKAAGFVGKLGIPGISPAAAGLSAVVASGGARPAAGAITAAATSMVKRAGRAVVAHPVLSAAAGAGAVGMAGAAVESMISGVGAPMRGMHPCKGLRPGHKPRPCKHGAMVPNRRMNPFNPRAARRAARRLHSLVRHYRKYIGFVSAKRPKGRPYIKRGKRK